MTKRVANCWLQLSSFLLFVFSSCRHFVLSPFRPEIKKTRQNEALKHDKLDHYLTGCICGVFVHWNHTNEEGRRLNTLQHGIIK